MNHFCMYNVGFFIEIKQVAEETTIFVKQNKSFCIPIHSMPLRQIFTSVYTVL